MTLSVSNSAKARDKRPLDTPGRTTAPSRFGSRSRAHFGPAGPAALRRKKLSGTGIFAAGHSVAGDPGWRHRRQRCPAEQHPVTPRAGGVDALPVRCGSANTPLMTGSIVAGEWLLTRSRTS